MDGNPVHKLAKKPVVKKIEEKVDDKDDFPFNLVNKRFQKKSGASQWGAKSGNLTAIL